MRRIAAVFVIVTLVLVGLIVVRLRAQQRDLRGPTRGSGTIEGTAVDLAAKLSARVLRVETTEGAAVKRGDLLLTLDCAEPQAMLAEAEARLAAAEAQARAAQLAAGAAQVSQKAARASTEASRAQAAALAAQRDATRRQAERLDAVAGDVAASSRDQVTSSAAALEHQLKAAESSSQALGAQASAAANQALASVAQADAASASVKASEAAVVRARLLVAECDVRAPRDAVVELLPYEAGELVAPGAVLARLVDLREVKAIFYVPNAELSAVRTGARAQVVADAWPRRTFEGTVKTVALEAEFTPRNIQTRTDRDRLVYPVEVRIDNADLALRPGMPVQVTLAGTER